MLEEKRPKSKSDKHRLHVLYLGHIGKEKGSFDLLSAAKTVLKLEHDVIFEFVGQEQKAGDIDKLSAQIVDAGLEQNIRISPAVSGAEKIKLFASADIFVYPSYHEGMPMAVIEALACGLPIVATRVGGIPDLVFPGLNGFLVSAGKPDHLANAIQQLIGNSQLRHSMQAASLRLALENFDIEKLVLQLLNIYRAVLLQR